MSTSTIHSLRTMQTYLHKNVEVKTTGRIARKEERTRRSVYDGAKEIELHEITPIDSTTGSWTAWVDLTDLYKIEVESSNDETEVTTGV